MQDEEKAEYYQSLPVPVDPPENMGPSPNNPPWNSGVAFGTWFLSVLFILIFPTLFVIPYLATRDGGMTAIENVGEFLKTDPTAVALQIISVFPAHFFTILMAWLVVTRGRKYSFTAMVGWKSGGVRWWHYVGFMVAFFVIAGAVTSVLPEQENDLIRLLKSSRTAVYLVSFLATFTAPFVEEVIYRGILYSAFQRTIGVAGAFVLATFLFAIVHLPQYYPSVSTMILLSLLSLSLTFVRVRSGNLLPCIILHTIFNGTQSLVMVLEPLFGSTGGGEKEALFFHLSRF